MKLAENLIIKLEKIDEMSSIRKPRTGLPVIMVVLDRTQTKLKKLPRVKFNQDSGDRTVAKTLISVVIDGEILKVVGTFASKRIEKKVLEFVKLNKSALVDHFNEVIDVADLIDRLIKIN